MYEYPDTDSESPESTERQNIEVWNDLVGPRDLIVCLAVAGVSAVVAVGAAHSLGGQLLFWGLGASVIGFVINCFLVARKRELIVIDDTDAPDDPADAVEADGTGEGSGPVLVEASMEEPAP